MQFVILIDYMIPLSHLLEKYLMENFIFYAVGYFNRLHDFSVTVPRCYKDAYVNSFFPRTAKLWNFLRISFGFKSRINRRLLTADTF